MWVMGAHVGKYDLQELGGLECLLGTGALVPQAIRGCRLEKIRMMPNLNNHNMGGHR